MDGIIRFFTLSDRVVDFLHGIIKLPWEEINKVITDLLPNKGMEFPYMLGRLCWWAILAAAALNIGILVRRRGVQTSDYKKGRKMEIDTVLSALSMWGVYALVGALIPVFVPSLQRARELFKRLFKGVGDLQTVLWILLGLVMAALILIGFFIFMLFPMVYYDRLKPVYGKLLTPFAFMMNIGIMSAALGVAVLALYYFIAGGGPVVVIKTVIALLILAAGLRALLFVSALVIHLTCMFVTSFGSGK